MTEDVRGQQAELAPLGGRRAPRTPRLGDVVAGLTVALVLVPQALAYAELAGLPSYRGLFAAFLPPLAASLFASSPYLQTGPVALTSLLTLGALLPLASVGSPRYVGMATLLALVVGVARIGIGLLRAGWVSYLMSQPMLVGFTTAASILIVASQLPGAVGVDGVGSGVLPVALEALSDPGGWQRGAVGFTVLTLVVILGSRRLSPRIPGTLIATVAGLLLAGLVGYGGAVVGPMPAGLRLPAALELNLPWDALPQLLLPGVVIALVGFAEAAAIARTYASTERIRWNPDQEFVSQGAANVASAFAGGFPVGGSFSRSSLNHLSGARTRFSGAVTGLSILLFFPFAGVLSPLPRAVLSAIVIAAVLGLIDVRGLVQLWRTSALQGIVAWSTFGLTLALAPRIERAVLVGVALSLLIHLGRELRVRAGAWTEGRELHLAPEGVLWFGSAPSLESVLLDRLSGERDLERLVVHLHGLGRIDLTGALALREILEEAEAAGLEVTLADVPEHARTVIDRVLPGRVTEA